MAFFDSVSKKITEKGQSAVKKTKEFAEITRINSMISNEERNVNNNYLQIGKLYFSMHSDNCEDEFSDLIMSIKDSEKKITNYREQIQTIKGIVKCLNCGAEVPNGSSFCSSCGAPMPKKTIENDIDDGFVACSNCGSYVKNDLRFCIHCGNPMNTITENKITTIKMCPNCGEETTEEDILFCISCGTKLVEKNNDQTPSEKRCTNCDFITTDDEIMFCTECGSKLV